MRDEHNNEESLRWDFWGEAYTDDAARQMAAQARLEWRAERAARFVMADAVTGEAAGVIGVMRMCLILGHEYDRMRLRGRTVLTCR